MKPDTNYPGSVFNFDAIPYWVKPELWDREKSVHCRGLQFVLLYILSTALFVTFFAIPIGIYLGIEHVQVTVGIWLALTLISGTLIGLGVWWDFIRECRKLALQEETNAQARSSDSV